MCFLKLADGRMNARKEDSSLKMSSEFGTASWVPCTVSAPSGFAGSFGDTGWSRTCLSPPARQEPCRDVLCPLTQI